jgi:hypothetical protein
MMKTNHANSIDSVHSLSFCSTEITDVMAEAISGGILAVEVKADGLGTSSYAFASSLDTVGIELPLNTKISLGKGFAEAIDSDRETTIESLSKNSKAIDYFQNRYFKFKEFRLGKGFFSFGHHY